MKKYIFKLLIVILISIVAFKFFNVKLYAQDKTIILAQNNSVIDVPQVKINNTAYVSAVRALELLGWSLNMDSTSQEKGTNKLHFIKGDNTLYISVVDTKVIYNGEVIPLERPVEVIDGELYIPSKFVAKEFGVQISWHSKDNLTILSGYDENSVYIEGEGNIIIAGNGIIINVFEAYNKDTLYDMLSYADRLLSKNKPEDAIVRYKDILSSINSDENQQLYTHVLINLGNAYGLLSEIKNVKANVNYAIDYFEKALELYTSEDVSGNHISLLNNLGNLYRVSFEITGDKTKLDKALSLLKEAAASTEQNTKPTITAIKTVDYTSNTSILEKASIFYNLAFTQKAEDIKELASDNMLTAVNFYSEALELHTFEKEPAVYSSIHYNIGNCNRFIGEILHDETKLNASIKAYKEAATFWCVESFPEKYARLCESLASAYNSKYYIDGNAENLKLAEGLFRESLVILSKDKYELDNAKINEKLADTYYEYATISNGAVEKSILRFNKALLFFYSNGYVVDCNRIAFKLSKSYNYFLLKKVLN